MITTTRLRFVAMLCGLLMSVDAAGDEPRPSDSKAAADRNAQKIPTKFAGTYDGGELVELRVRDRIAFLVKPTGAVDPDKRWLWDFPFWLAINDGFGRVAHRYYVEQALAAGFHIAGPTKGLDYGLSLEELERRAGEFNPIDNLAPLAWAGVKIQHLHGAEDLLVPTSPNATELARRYRELGGAAEIVLLPLPATKRGHDGPELYESAPLLKFLLGN